MTPKEKAKELVKKYSCYFHGIDENLFKEVVIHDDAKQCALIAVDEMLDELSNEDLYKKSNYIFWQEVKQEIEKL
jgi:hypothetical protein